MTSKEYGLDKIYHTQGYAPQYDIRLKMKEDFNYMTRRDKIIRDMNLGDIAELHILDLIAGRIYIEVKAEIGKWQKTGNFYIERMDNNEGRKETGIYHSMSKSEILLIVFIDNHTKTLISSIEFDIHLMKLWIEERGFKLIPGGDIINGKPSKLGYAIPITRHVDYMMWVADRLRMHS